MTCTPGLYYRTNGRCIKCPETNIQYLIYAGLALLAISLITGGYYLNKAKVSVALIAIGVDYFQVVSMFASTNIAWPPQVCSCTMSMYR